MGSPASAVKTHGRLRDIQVPFRSKSAVISFEVAASPEDIEQYADMDLDITIAKHRKKRSLDANAFLWECLGTMAAALKTDNWTMYLYELERYGKFTHILVKPEAVEDLKKVWRETKVVGEVDGMTEILCFFGSSTYDTAEFSRLIDGVISDMKDMNIPVPPTAAMIAEMERHDTSGRQKEKGKGGKK